MGGDGRGDFSLEILPRVCRCRFQLLKFPSRWLALFLKLGEHLSAHNSPFVALRLHARGETLHGCVKIARPLRNRSLVVLALHAEPGFAISMPAVGDPCFGHYRHLFLHGFERADRQSQVQSPPLSLPPSRQPRFASSSSFLQSQNPSSRVTRHWPSSFRGIRNGKIHAGCLSDREGSRGRRCLGTQHRKLGKFLHSIAKNTGAAAGLGRQDTRDRVSSAGTRLAHYSGNPHIPPHRTGGNHG